MEAEERRNRSSGTGPPLSMEPSSQRGSLSLTPAKPTKPDKPMDKAQLDLVLVEYRRRVLVLEAPEVVWGCLRNEPKSLRRVLLRCLFSDWFELFVGVCIVVNAVILMLWQPLQPVDSPLNSFVNSAQLPFTILFSAELLLKFLALGFWLFWFSDAFNILDFIVVVLGYISLSPSVANLNAIRMLRLLRMLSMFGPTRVVLVAVGNSIAGLSHLACLAILFLLTFSLLGVQLWAGVMSGRCGYVDPGTNQTLFSPYGLLCSLPCSSSSDPPCTPSYGDSCPSNPGLAVPITNFTAAGVPFLTTAIMPLTCMRDEPPDYGQRSFDNVLYAMLVSFVSWTTESWSATMVALWQTWGVDWLVAILFVAFTFLGSLFILELALAVIRDKYRSAKAAEEQQKQAMIDSLSQLGVTPDGEAIKRMSEFGPNSQPNSLPSSARPSSSGGPGTASASGSISGPPGKGPQKATLATLSSALRTASGSGSRKKLDMHRLSQNLLTLGRVAAAASGHRTSVMGGSRQSFVGRMASSNTRSSAFGGRGSVVGGGRTQTIGRQSMVNFNRSMVGNGNAGAVITITAGGGGGGGGATGGSRASMAMTGAAKGGSRPSMANVSGAIVSAATGAPHTHPVGRASMAMPMGMGMVGVMPLGPGNRLSMAPTAPPGIVPGGPRGSRARQTVIGRVSLLNEMGLDRRTKRSVLKSIHANAMAEGGRGGDGGLFDALDDEDRCCGKVVDCWDDTLDACEARCWDPCRENSSNCVHSMLPCCMNDKGELECPKTLGRNCFYYNSRKCKSRYKKMLLAKRADRCYRRHVPGPPPWMRAGANAIMNTALYTAILVCVVFVNAAILGCSYEGMPQSTANAIAVVNAVVVAIFIGDLLLSLIAKGVKKAVFSSYLAAFDALVVLASCLDIILDTLDVGGNAVSLLRIARVLRVVKIFDLWPSLRALVVDLLATLPSAFSAALVLAIFMLAMAVLGLHLFGGQQYQIAVTNGIITEIPRYNFNTLANALITTFVLVDNENWNDILFSHMAVFGPASALYFVIVLLLGNMALLNVVTAVILQSMEARSDPPVAVEGMLLATAKQIWKSLVSGVKWTKEAIVGCTWKKFGKCLFSCCCCCCIICARIRKSAAVIDSPRKSSGGSGGGGLAGTMRTESGKARAPNGFRGPSPSLHTPSNSKLPPVSILRSGSLRKSSAGASSDPGTGTPSSAASVAPPASSSSSNSSANGTSNPPSVSTYSSAPTAGTNALTIPSSDAIIPGKAASVSAADAPMSMVAPPAASSLTAGSPLQPASPSPPPGLVNGSAPNTRASTSSAPSASSSASSAGSNSLSRPSSAGAVRKPPPFILLAAGDSDSESEDEKSSTTTSGGKEGSDRGSKAPTVGNEERRLLFTNSFGSYGNVSGGKSTPTTTLDETSATAVTAHSRGSFVGPLRIGSSKKGLGLLGDVVTDLTESGRDKVQNPLAGPPAGPPAAAVGVSAAVEDAIGLADDASTQPSRSSEPTMEEAGLLLSSSQHCTSPVPVAAPDFDPSHMLLAPVAPPLPALPANLPSTSLLLGETKEDAGEAPARSSIHLPSTPAATIDTAGGDDGSATPHTGRTKIKVRIAEGTREASPFASSIDTADATAAAAAGAGAGLESVATPGKRPGSARGRTLARIDTAYLAKKRAEAFWLAEGFYRPPSAVASPRSPSLASPRRPMSAGSPSSARRLDLTLASPSRSRTDRPRSAAVILASPRPEVTDPELDDELFGAVAADAPAGPTLVNDEGAAPSSAGDDFDPDLAGAFSSEADILHAVFEEPELTKIKTPHLSKYDKKAGKGQSRPGSAASASSANDSAFKLAGSGSGSGSGRDGLSKEDEDLEAGIVQDDDDSEASQNDDNDDEYDDSIDEFDSVLHDDKALPAVFIESGQLHAVEQDFEAAIQEVLDGADVEEVFEEGEEERQKLDAKEAEAVATESDAVRAVVVTDPDAALSGVAKKDRPKSARPATIKEENGAGGDDGDDDGIAEDAGKDGEEEDELDEFGLKAEVLTETDAVKSKRDRPESAIKGGKGAKPGLASREGKAWDTKAAPVEGAAAAVGTAVASAVTDKLAAETEILVEKPTLRIGRGADDEDHEEEKKKAAANNAKNSSKGVPSPSAPSPPGPLVQQLLAPLLTPPAPTPKKNPPPPPPLSTKKTVPKAPPRVSMFPTGPSSPGAPGFPSTPRKNPPPPPPRSKRPTRPPGPPPNTPRKSLKSPPPPPPRLSKRPSRPPGPIPMTPGRSNRDLLKASATSPDLKAAIAMATAATESMRSLKPAATVAASRPTGSLSPPAPAADMGRGVSAPVTAGTSHAYPTLPSHASAPSVLAAAANGSTTATPRPLVKSGTGSFVISGTGVPAGASAVVAAAAAALAASAAKAEAPPIPPNPLRSLVGLSVLLRRNGLLKHATVIIPPTESIPLPRLVEMDQFMEVRVRVLNEQVRAKIHTANLLTAPRLSRGQRLTMAMQRIASKMPGRSSGTSPGTSRRSTASPSSRPSSVHPDGSGNSSPIGITVRGTGQVTNTAFQGSTSSVSLSGSGSSASAVARNKKLAKHGKFASFVRFDSRGMLPDYRPSVVAIAASKGEALPPENEGGVLGWVGGLLNGGNDDPASQGPFSGQFSGSNGPGPGSPGFGVQDNNNNNGMSRDNTSSTSSSFYNKPLPSAIATENESLASARALLKALEIRATGVPTKPLPENWYRAKLLAQAMASSTILAGVKMHDADIAQFDSVPPAPEAPAPVHATIAPRQKGGKGGGTARASRRPPVGATFGGSRPSSAVTSGSTRPSQAPVFAFAPDENTGASWEPSRPSSYTTIGSARPSTTPWTMTADSAMTVGSARPSTVPISPSARPSGMPMPASSVPIPVSARPSALPPIMAMPVPATSSPPAAAPTPSSSGNAASGPRASRPPPIMFVMGDSSSEEETEKWKKQEDGNKLPPIHSSPVPAFSPPPAASSRPSATAAPAAPVDNGASSASSASSAPRRTAPPMMMVLVDEDYVSSEEDRAKGNEEKSPVPLLPKLQMGGGGGGGGGGGAVAHATADALFSSDSGGQHLSASRSSSPPQSSPSSARPLLPPAAVAPGYGPRYSNVAVGGSPSGFSPSAPNNGKQPVKSALKKSFVAASPSGSPPSASPGSSSPSYGPRPSASAPPTQTLAQPPAEEEATGIIEEEDDDEDEDVAQEEETPKALAFEQARPAGGAQAGARPSNSSSRGPPPFVLVQSGGSGGGGVAGAGPVASGAGGLRDSNNAPRPGGIGGMRSSSKNRRHTPYNRAALSAVRDEDEEEDDDDEDEDDGRGAKSNQFKGANKSLASSDTPSSSSGSLRNESKRRLTPFVRSPSQDSKTKGCCARRFPGCCRWFTDCKAWWASCCCCCRGRSAASSTDLDKSGDQHEGEGDGDGGPKLSFKDTALGYWFVARQLCREIDDNFLFVWFVNIVILISCVNLALDAPNVQTCYTPVCNALKGYLAVADVIITVVFVVEFCVQIMARGVIRGPEAYFRSGWRWVDALTTAASIASLVATSDSTRALRALRAARALRPLRLIARIPRLKLVVDALLGSFPRARNVLFLIFVVIYLLALIGLLFFRGHFYSCNDPSMTTQASCVGFFYPEPEQCDLLPTEQLAFACLGGASNTLVPRIWASQRFNFDSIGASLQTVFDLLTGEGWPSIALVGIDSSTTSGASPNREATLGASTFYILCELTMNIVLLELIASVVVDTYQRLKNERNGASMLSRTQASFMANIRVAMAARPPQTVKAPRMKGQHPKVAEMRKKVFKLVGSTVFEWLVMAIVGLSAVASSLTFYGQSTTVLRAQEVINWVVTVLFVMEAGLKLFGLGTRQYFQSSWNVFDFVLVIGSILSAILQSGILGSILRVFRIARVFRVVRVSSGLQRLLRTFLVSVPSFLNILTIFSLNVFIFSVVGMNLFSGVKLTVNSVLNDYCNFDSFAQSIISLLRFSTGEDFPVMARDLAVQPPYCIPDGPDENCGVAQATATLFFVVFFITSVMILAMLTAVILEAFDESSDEDLNVFDVYRLTPNIATLYSFLWVQEDRRVRMFLPIEKLQRIVASLPTPFGTGPPDALQRLQQLVGAYGGAATTDETDDEEEEAKKAREEEEQARTRKRFGGFKSKKDRRSTVKRGVLRSISGKLMRTQSGALMETIDGIPANSLLAAARVIAKLPLVPSKDGTYSFYAVLLALCEQASRVTPLGAPINVVVSASAAAPPVGASGVIGGSIATPTSAASTAMNSDIEQPSLQETSAALLVQRRWRARKAGLLVDAEEAAKAKEAEDAASAEAAARAEGFLTDSRGRIISRNGREDHDVKSGRSKSRF